MENIIFEPRKYYNKKNTINCSYSGNLFCPFCYHSDENCLYVNEYEKELLNKYPEYKKLYYPIQQTIKKKSNLSSKYLMYYCNNCNIFYYKCCIYKPAGCASDIYFPIIITKYKINDIEYIGTPNLKNFLYNYEQYKNLNIFFYFKCQCNGHCFDSSGKLKIDCKCNKE